MLKIKFAKFTETARVYCLFSDIKTIKKSSISNYDYSLFYKRNLYISDKFLSKYKSLKSIMGLKSQKKHLSEKNQNLRQIQGLKTTFSVVSEDNAVNRWFFSLVNSKFIQFGIQNVYEEPYIQELDYLVNLLLIDNAISQHRSYYPMLIKRLEDIYTEEIEEVFPTEFFTLKPYDSEILALNFDNDIENISKNKHEKQSIIANKFIKNIITVLETAKTYIKTTKQVFALIYTLCPLFLQTRKGYKKIMQKKKKNNVSFLFNSPFQKIKDMYTSLTSSLDFLEYDQRNCLSVILKSQGITFHGAIQQGGRTSQQVTDLLMDNMSTILGDFKADNKKQIEEFQALDKQAKKKIVELKTRLKVLIKNLIPWHKEYLRNISYYYINIFNKNRKSLEYRLYHWFYDFRDDLVLYYYYKQDSITENYKTSKIYAIQLIKKISIQTKQRSQHMIHSIKHLVKQTISTTKLNFINFIIEKKKKILAFFTNKKEAFYFKKTKIKNNIVSKKLKITKSYQFIKERNSKELLDFAIKGLKGYITNLKKKCTVENIKLYFHEKKENTSTSIKNAGIMYNYFKYKILYKNFLITNELKVKVDSVKIKIESKKEKIKQIIYKLIPIYSEIIRLKDLVKGHIANFINFINEKRIKRAEYKKLEKEIEEAEALAYYQKLRNKHPKILKIRFANSQKFKPNQAPRFHQLKKQVKKKEDLEKITVKEREILDIADVAITAQREIRENRDGMKEAYPISKKFTLYFNLQSKNEYKRLIDSLQKSTTVFARFKSYLYFIYRSISNYIKEFGLNLSYLPFFIPKKTFQIYNNKFVINPLISIFSFMFMFMIVFIPLLVQVLFGYYLIFDLFFFQYLFVDTIYTHIKNFIFLTYFFLNETYIFTVATYTYLRLWGGMFLGFFYSTFLSYPLVEAFRYFCVAFIHIGELQILFTNWFYSHYNHFILNDHIIQFEGYILMDFNVYASFLADNLEHWSILFLDVIDECVTDFLPYLKKSTYRHVGYANWICYTKLPEGASVYDLACSTYHQQLYFFLKNMSSLANAFWQDFLYSVSILFNTIGKPLQDVKNFHYVFFSITIKDLWNFFYTYLNTFHSQGFFDIFSLIFSFLIYTCLYYFLFIYDILYALFFFFYNYIFTLSFVTSILWLFTPDVYSYFELSPIIVPWIQENILYKIIIALIFYTKFYTTDLYKELISTLSSVIHMNIYTMILSSFKDYIHATHSIWNFWILHLSHFFFLIAIIFMNFINYFYSFFIVILSSFFSFKLIFYFFYECFFELFLFFTDFYYFIADFLNINFGAIRAFIIMIDDGFIDLKNMPSILPYSIGLIYYFMRTTIFTFVLLFYWIFYCFFKLPSFGYSVILFFINMVHLLIIEIANIIIVPIFVFINYLKFLSDPLVIALYDPSTKTYSIKLFIISLRGSGLHHWDFFSYTVVYFFQFFSSFFSYIFHSFFLVILDLFSTIFNYFFYFSSLYIDGLFVIFYEWFILLHIIISSFFIKILPTIWDYWANFYIMDTIDEELLELLEAQLNETLDFILFIPFLIEHWYNIICLNVFYSLLNMILFILNIVLFGLFKEFYIFMIYVFDVFFFQLFFECKPFLNQVLKPVFDSLCVCVEVYQFYIILFMEWFYIHFGWLIDSYNHYKLTKCFINGDVNGIEEMALKYSIASKT